MNTYAIGDIHGHYSQTMKLMEKLPIKKDDVVVFMGDYVDGGPDSAKVVAQLMKWQKENPHWKFLYGNHEDLMLDALVNNSRVYSDPGLWWNQGGKATAKSYGFNRYRDVDIPFSHLTWLQSLPLFYENDDYFFVHAGVSPDKELQDYRDFPREHIKELVWIREEFITSEKDWGKKIIFGHTVWPQIFDGIKYGTYKEPLIMENKIGIDQMHYNDGVMIAVKLPEEKFYFQEAE